MVTRSTEEAVAVLLRSLTRRHLIMVGRAVARELIALLGTTHVREVRAEMIRLGHGPDIEAVGSDQWLGVVFRSRDFKATGDTYTPPESEPSHNVHSWHPVNIWRMRRPEER